MQYPNKLIYAGVNDPECIKLIKQRLNELGFGHFDITNPSFGPATTVSVKDFQRRYQLKDDGVVGELTWERLFFGRLEEPVNSLHLPERVYQRLHTQLFVREKTGLNDGYEVEMYLFSVGLHKGYAWCQAFQYWGFNTESIALGTKNPMPKTAGVLNHRDIIKSRGINGPGKIIRPSEVQPYDIGILDFHKNYEGHTFMISKVAGDKVWTIEGNTNSQGGRDGNGVFERVRLISTLDCAIRY